MGRQNPFVGTSFSAAKFLCLQKLIVRKNPSAACIISSLVTVDPIDFIVARNCITSRNAGKTGMGGGRREEA